MPVYMCVQLRDEEKKFLAKNKTKSSPYALSIQAMHLDVFIKLLLLYYFCNFYFVLIAYWKICARTILLNFKYIGNSTEEQTLIYN